MKLLTLLIITLISSTVFPQFNSFKKKNKFGVIFNKQTILNAKFDSVVIYDEYIVTCYKKNKIYYFNSDGKKIYKNDIKDSEPFINGMAICNNRKGYFLINNKGENCSFSYKSEKPKRHNNIVVINGKSKSIYHNGKCLIFDYKASWIDNTWIGIIYEERHEHVYKPLFRKSRIHYTYTMNKSLYNSFTGERDFYDVDSIIRYPNYTYAILKDKSGVLAKNNGTSVKKKIHFLNNLSDSIICYTADITIDSTTIWTLVNHHSQSILFETKAKKITFEKNTFFSYRSDNKIDILTYEGKVVRSNLTLVKIIGNYKYIFENEYGQYIGDSKGENLSDYFKSFDNFNEQFIVAINSNYYTYLSLVNYKSIDIKLPLINYNSPEKKLNFLEAFGNMMLGLILQQPIYTETGEKIYPLKKHNFENGLAIVPVTYKNYSPVYDSNYTLSNQEITYNYIDTNGNYLNSEMYIDCNSFERDTAWVKDKNGYFPINNLGKSLSKDRYSRIEKLPNFYYKVYKNTKWGILDANLNLIVPCKYDVLEIRKDIIYGKLSTFDEDEIKLYQVPN